MSAFLRPIKFPLWGITTPYWIRAWLQLPQCTLALEKHCFTSLCIKSIITKRSLTVPIAIIIHVRQLIIATNVFILKYENKNNDNDNDNDNVNANDNDNGNDNDNDNDDDKDNDDDNANDNDNDNDNNNDNDDDNDNDNDNNDDNDNDDDNANDNDNDNDNNNDNDDDNDNDNDNDNDDDNDNDNVIYKTTIMIMVYYIYESFDRVFLCYKVRKEVTRERKKYTMVK